MGTKMEDGQMKEKVKEKRTREKKRPAAVDKRKMTLKEKLNYSEDLFKKTGHYHGIQRLKLRDNDPLRFEKVFGKLRGALVSARESALHISASPIVRNIGELCFALYTPEGDSITLSTGIIVHVHTISEFIKYMIRNDYEDDPGIRHGDIFCNNDAAIGGVHTSDVSTAVPIFYEDQLVGWAAGVTHEPDCGSSMPGHSPTQPQSRFEDGYIIVADKIGENDKIFKTYRMRSLKSTRTPMYWDLDEKARLAGCHKIREALMKIIEEEGSEYYLRFIREIIEEGRQIALARVKERLVPGRYRAPSVNPIAFVEVALGKTERPRQDILANAPVEITVMPDGELYFSTDGASRSQPFPFNCSETAMQGALWVLLSQLLFYDGRVNDGSYLAVKSYFPPGSGFNPTDPFASYSCAWPSLMACFTGLIRCLSRGFYSRGYREEVVSSYGETTDSTQGGGYLEDGTYFPLATFDISSVGMGAGAVRDGLDYGYAMWNPESDMGDIEVWESLELGFPWLGRRVKKDTAGFGKFRGATDWENLRVAYGVKSLFAYMVRGGGVSFICNGLMGGYPNATSYRSSMLKSNLAEVTQAKKLYPTGEGDPNDSELKKLLQGDYTIHKRGATMGGNLNNGDILHGNMNGSCGFGDPLLRDIELVKKDLEDEVYSPGLVRRVYGVVASYDNEHQKWVIDEAATGKERRKILDIRRTRATDFKDFFEKERQIIIEKKLIEPIKNMYRESMELSPKWAQEFKDYYGLQEDFQF
jgi:N-methylhydantoinase B/oxoprolinase/acetone carboxylase alpha subunit